MKILFLSGHPAQVHNFKILKEILEERGHQTFWLATDKDISIYLLNIYKINFELLERPGKTKILKFKSLLLNTIKCIRYIKRNNINLVISRVSPYASLACFYLRKPHIALADTETSGIYDEFFTKFVSALLTAKSFIKQLRSDQIRFNGNIELFYLHPKRFLPDSNVFDLLGIKSHQPYIIMRFVSWKAYHDKGLYGFTNENKKKAVEEFSKFAKVFISAENELPEELERYRIKIQPEKMHDVLAHSTLFFGESATMASESAVLGIPAIYLNENWLGYTDEEEHYGLLYSFKQSALEQEKAIKKAVELLNYPDLKNVMKDNHENFLRSKIDVTGFMIWFIENYPQSFKIMKENPDYQLRFK